MLSGFGVNGQDIYKNRLTYLPATDPTIMLLSQPLCAFAFVSLQ